MHVPDVHHDSKRSPKVYKTLILIVISSSCTEHWWDVCLWCRQERNGKCRRQCAWQRTQRPAGLQRGMIHNSQIFTSLWRCSRLLAAYDSPCYQQRSAEFRDCSTPRCSQGVCCRLCLYQTSTPTVDKSLQRNSIHILDFYYLPRKTQLAYSQNLHTRGRGVWLLLYLDCCTFVSRAIVLRHSCSLWQTVRWEVRYYNVQLCSVV